MIKYPEVKHKIPGLFEEIIANDNKMEALKESPISSFEEFKELKEERQRLRIGAEKFIQKQKGGNVI